MMVLKAHKGYTLSEEGLDSLQAGKSFPPKDVSLTPVRFADFCVTEILENCSLKAEATHRH